jgi:hypothetical protein
MASTLSFLAIVAVCSLMLWAAYRIEPHWVSKDAQRMVCYGQGLGRDGQSDGRWREVRVAKVRDDTVEVRPRRGSLMNAGRDRSVPTARSLVPKRLPKASYWKVIGPSETPPRRRAVYLLDGGHDPGLPFMFALRMPANSKAIPMLDAVAANRYATTPTTASTPSPETPQSAEPPDQG